MGEDPYIQFNRREGNDMVVSVDWELEYVIGESWYSRSRLKLVEEGVCRDRGSGIDRAINGIEIF